MSGVKYPGRSRSFTIAAGIVGRLSDEELLALHRIVCRRAAQIYEPMYRDKRLVNQRIGSAVARWAR